MRRCAAVWWLVDVIKPYTLAAGGSQPLRRCITTHIIVDDGARPEHTCSATTHTTQSFSQGQLCYNPQQVFLTHPTPSHRGDIHLRTALCLLSSCLTAQDALTKPRMRMYTSIMTSYVHSSTGIMTSKRCSLPPVADELNKLHGTHRYMIAS